MVGPPDRPAFVGRSAPPMVLSRHQADLGGLDAQRSIVGDEGDPAPVVVDLAERSGQDAVVGLGRVEAVGGHLVEVQSVRLDLERAPTGQVDGRADVAPVGDPQHLDAADHRASRAPHVIRAGLQRVELLDDDERDDGGFAREREHRLGIGDEHGGVEHHPVRAGHRDVCGRVGKGGEEVSHGAPWVSGGQPGAARCGRSVG